MTALTGWHTRLRYRVIWGNVEEDAHGGTTHKGVRKNFRQALEEGEDPAESIALMF